MSFVNTLLNDKQIDRFLRKIFKLDSIYQSSLIKEKILLEAKLIESDKLLYVPPIKGNKLVKLNDTWGKEFGYGWFSLDLSKQNIDENTYLLDNSGSPESLVYVNNQPYGMFDVTEGVKDGIFRRHEYLRLNSNVSSIDVNAYASHTFPGTMPYERNQTFGLINNVPVRTYKGFYLVRYNEEVKTLIDHIKFLSSYYQTINPLEKRQFIDLCVNIYKVIDWMPENTSDYSGVVKANIYIDEFLDELKEGLENDATILLLGHSHLDTVWLWGLEETKKKFIETVSTAVRLLNAYPKYKFMMSSILHFDWLRVNQPELFEEVLRLEKLGRFEINGATYVEPDCNLTGSESLIRQFVRGQRWMMKYTNKYADSFFLPDTFGYSSAIPQIIQKSQAKYFLTTKLRWNDTNKFPYDTFYWKGIDGSKVLTHFNWIHVNPDPQSLLNIYNSTPDKMLNESVLITYGFGDGGGGNSEEMVRDAILSEETIKEPNVKHVTVSEAMNHISKKEYPTFTNELYLELHRATYTSNHMIKYLNRKTEFVLHNIEYISALYNNDLKEMSDKAYDVLMQNQFHDILPATSIKIAADQAISENTKVIKDINDTIKETFNSNITIQDNLVTLINPNGIKTSKTQVLDGKYNLEGYLNQTVNILGNDKTFVEVSLDSYETKVFELSNKGTKNKEGFVLNKDVDRVNTISTELYNVEFDNNMYITSLFDKRENRETVQGAFNRFNMGQHVPLLWDNWDFDKDYTFKMEDVNNLISSKVVSNGELVLVIENIYQLTKESILTQNMVFYKNEVRIDFFTKIDWNSTYLVLKTYFDTNIIAPNFKSEVQFGYETRSTLNNYSHEQAQFEVVNHKWTNLGESDYQVSILNDSSYGISVKDRVMGLTLLTSGTRPDPTASRGINYMNYSIVLNNNSFNVLDTISPSYLLNNPIMVVEGRLDENVFAKVDNSKVIIETIKIGENEGIVLRLYESTFNHVNTNLVLNDTYTIYETNMLEEEKVLLGNSNSISLNFKPFEIKTLLLIK